MWCFSRIYSKYTNYYNSRAKDLKFIIFVDYGTIYAKDKSLIGRTPKINTGLHEVVEWLQFYIKFLNVSNYFFTGFFNSSLLMSKHRYGVSKKTYLNNAIRCRAQTVFFLFSSTHFWQYIFEIWCHWTVTQLNRLCSKMKKTVRYLYQTKHHALTQCMSKSYIYQSLWNAIVL